jgi:GT2 family glycosyltransferase
MKAYQFREVRNMTAEVTIVHVPRERYGETRNSLESILKHSRDVRHELLILDADSPPEISTYLQKVAEEESNRRYVRFDYILTPNELRNKAIGLIETPYIAFVDNDAVVSEGWLKSMLRTAKKTGAWVVGPTQLIGSFDKGVIHLAGGDCQVVEMEGKRIFSYLQQRHCGEKLREVGDGLSTSPCTVIEFHCMLVRRNAFDRIGPLDERLMSFTECEDFCMSVVKAGGSIYYEPESVVTYLPPREKLSAADMKYFLLRWSDDWNNKSLATFAKKWDLSPDQPWIDHAKSWPKTHRRFAIRQLAWPLGKLGGILQYRFNHRLGNGLIDRIEASYVRSVSEKRSKRLTEQLQSARV